MRVGRHLDVTRVLLGVVEVEYNLLVGSGVVYEVEWGVVGTLMWNWVSLG